MTDRRDRWIRIVAGLCLAVLMNSWAPHAHSNATHSDRIRSNGTNAKGDRPTTMSADIAHEEHSSGYSTEANHCAFCRSGKEREGARARAAHEIPIVASPNPHHAARRNVLPSAVWLRLHSTRAPPKA